MPKSQPPLRKVMNHSNEWYWNLNIHRDQMTLATTPVSTAVHLPTTSSCYTNAVITDVGLCVGMRNVRLNTESQSCVGKGLKMPNCCSNLNVVGQHNEQIWAVAYDRMKYSAPPPPPPPMDPMFGYAYAAEPSFHHHDNWRSQPCCDHATMARGKMCASSNPFLLFGDRSKMPALQAAGCFEPVASMAGRLGPMAVPMKLGHARVHSHMGGDIHVARHRKPRHSRQRHYNNRYRTTVCGPTSTSSSSLPSSASSSPHFESAANCNPFIRKDDANVSRSDHAAPPKKKWMQNYMQINHALNGEDSSQSSLNLSASSGYLSGSSSANSSVGGSNLNLSGRSSSSSLSNGGSSHITNGQVANGNGSVSIHANGDHGNHGFYEKSPNMAAYADKRNGNLAQQNAMPPTNSRRRTISSNSNGGTTRSASIHRAGTREVHNKLEKNRRAHLKECFETLKKQLPLMNEAKKTSNLQILSNASKFISTLKRKDRELEQETENLAKEKIAKHQKLMLLRRQLGARFDNNDSTMPEAHNNRARERVSSECLSEQSLPSRVRYGSTSSLSSAATASSPCAAGMPSQSAMTTSISPVITTSSTILNISTSSPSPKRAHPSSPNSVASLTNTNQVTLHATAAITTDPPTANIKKSLPNGLTATNGYSKAHNQPIAINLSTSDGISPALLSASNAAMPINLNKHGLASNGSSITKTTVTSNGMQIISSTNNNTITSNNNTTTVTVSNGGGKNGVRPSVIDTNEHHHNSKELHKKSEEPPTKVIKLINGNGITLASVDKDSKLIPPSQLTLSQVVVSQIPQLITPTQTLRVIGPGNGVATIELGNATKVNGPQHQNSLPNGTNGAHLHKLLVNRGSANAGTPVITSTMNGSNGTSELGRLPGGAELNILPPSSNGATLYRSNGQLAIIKGIHS